MIIILTTGNTPSAFASRGRDELSRLSKQVLASMGVELTILSRQYDINPAILLNDDVFQLCVTINVLSMSAFLCPTMPMACSRDPPKGISLQLYLKIRLPRCSGVIFFYPVMQINIMHCCLVITLSTPAPVQG